LYDDQVCLGAALFNPDGQSHAIPVLLSELCFPPCMALDFTYGAAVAWVNGLYLILGWLGFWLGTSWVIC